jgi:hypothetical protein
MLNYELYRHILCAISPNNVEYGFEGQLDLLKGLHSLNLSATGLIS